MVASIIEKFGTEVSNLTLIPSSGGVYKIWKDDVLLFSKQVEGRFPNSDDEVTSKM